MNHSDITRSRSPQSYMCYLGNPRSFRENNICLSTCFAHIFAYMYFSLWHTISYNLHFPSKTITWDLNIHLLIFQTFMFAFYVSFWGLYMLLVHVYMSFLYMYSEYSSSYIRHITLLEFTFQHPTIQLGVSLKQFNYPTIQIWAFTFKARCFWWLTSITGRIWISFPSCMTCNIVLSWMPKMTFMWQAPPWRHVIIVWKGKQQKTAETG